MPLHFEHELAYDLGRPVEVTRTGEKVAWSAAGACFVSMIVAVVILDDVPAHYIFVMLVQATLFPWMLAAVFYLWQGRGIPVADLLKPAVRNSGAPGSALSALSASVPPTTVPHMLWIASGLTLSLVLAVVAYILDCWDEATGDAHDCRTGSPIPLEFAALVVALLLLVLPWPLPAWKQRKQFGWHLSQCLACVVGVPALSFEVRFIHVLITDALTSSCLLLWDLEYAGCLYSTSSWAHGKGQSKQGELCGASSWNSVYVKPAIIALPFWLRFVQCVWQAASGRSLKQAANAVKYCTALSVVGCSASMNWWPDDHDFWFRAWIISLVVKTSYCYYWDVVHDWGLIAWETGRCRPRVRAWRLYRGRVYAGVLVFNFLGRISWSLAISPQFCNHSCRLACSLLEIVRRGVWLVFRVEYEFTMRSESLSAARGGGIQAMGGRSSSVEFVPLIASPDPYND